MAVDETCAIVVEGGAMRGVRQHDAVELHDIGIQLPDPFDVRMARAEVVERDQEAALAELTHCVGETFEVFRALFEHFEHDAPRRQVQCVASMALNHLHPRAHGRGAPPADGVGHVEALAQA